MSAHKGTEKIATERLILRRYLEQDSLEAFENFLGSDEVTKYMTFTAYKSEDGVKEWIRHCLDGYGGKDFYNWVIIEVASGALIGSIGANVAATDAETMSFGYCLGKKWWGKGYATEAAKAVLSYLHCECGANKFTVKHAYENVASGSVIEKCGFKYVSDSEYEKSDGTVYKCREYILYM